jgi:hypothetical protein
MRQLFRHSKELPLHVALLSVALQRVPAGCSVYEHTVLLTGPVMGRQNVVALGVQALSSLPAYVRHNTLWSYEHEL